MEGGNHAALWRGRFQSGPDAAAVEFETSIHLDSRMAMDDIRGSRAHAQMLAKTGIISEEEGRLIAGGLDSIGRDIESGALAIDEGAEDIHSFIEAALTDRIGEAGKKVHTARSRNDQVALDERLFLSREIPKIQGKIKSLAASLAKIARAHTRDIMPGYTHMQRAQPVTLAHHLCAWAWGFTRDHARFSDALRRSRLSPIGACALAGTTLPIDREYEASLLGFDGVTQNSLDTVSDRDFCLETLSACAIAQTRLSRCCEEIVLWSTSEFSFVDLSESWSTGSSIMPQKKNPDFAELVRGRTGMVFGDLIALLATMKGLPLSYNRDMQEDKRPLFDALDTLSACLDVFRQMAESAKWNTARMEGACGDGFLNATDAADYLSRKGMPFRDAHAAAAKLVRAAIQKKCRLSDLSLDDFKGASELFEGDIYEAIDLRRCVTARETTGGPAPERVEEQIAALEKFCAESQ